jgi:hypothetical protein
MKWTTLDHNFCEGKLYGSPEYYNSFSSLFITYFGLLGLYKTNNDLMIQIIYALLSVNGISSFMYHWTGNIGYALYDEYPMILALFLGNIYVENLIPSYYKKSKILFNINLMIIYLVIDVMENQRLIFPYYFASGLIIVLYNIHRLVNNIYYKSIINHSYNTNYYIYVIISSAITWGLTEINCNSNNRILYDRLYLIGHPMWHFMISYGFYNLIQIVYNVKMYLN